MPEGSVVQRLIDGEWDRQTDRYGRQHERRLIQRVTVFARLGKRLIVTCLIVQSIGFVWVTDLANDYRVR